MHSSIELRGVLYISTRGHQFRALPHPMIASSWRNSSHNSCADSFTVDRVYRWSDSLGICCLPVGHDEWSVVTEFPGGSLNRWKRDSGVPRIFEEPVRRWIYGRSVSCVPYP